MHADTTTNPARTTAQLHQLLADEWQFRMQEDPLLATRCGDHRYNDRLPAVSEADFMRRLAQLRRFYQQLQSIDRSPLSPADRLTYDVFHHTLRDEIAQLEFRSHLLPMRKREGFHVFFADLPNTVPLRTVEDYENYIARLNGFSTYAAQHIELMRAGMREGYTPAKPAWEGAEESVRSHVVERPEQSLLFQPFQRFPATVPDTQRARLLASGAGAVMDSVVEGYRSLLHFLVDEYIPAARATIAASALPAGPAYYEHCIRYATTLDISPQQVHEMGMAEVERIRAEMEEIVHNAGFQGDFRRFVSFLRTDERFYVDTPRDLLVEAAFVLKRMEGELPTLFKTLPRTPCALRPIPDYIAPKTTSAYYSEPTGDGTKAGTYYLNTYALKSRPLYELEALTLHEAVPGHHLHIALQQEMADLPNFRRFGYIMAFGEGWALYAERLGLEAGFYTDSYSDFGRLSFEMWRATRLVVDTGMHYLGWTRQQAIDFMAEHTALTLLNIVNEVDRYIDWPGQALAYKIGELKIRELRQQAEQALGSNFDVRVFHDVVLRNGSLPLAVLETAVHHWIGQQGPTSRLEASTALRYAG